eukprot:5203302-Pyramimonas_sp.AAC.1
MRSRWLGSNTSSARGSKSATTTTTTTTATTTTTTTTSTSSSAEWRAERRRARRRREERRRARVECQGAPPERGAPGGPGAFCLGGPQSINQSTNQSTSAQHMGGGGAAGWRRVRGPGHLRGIVEAPDRPLRGLLDAS